MNSFSETICTGGRTEESLTTEGTGTGLWFQAGPTPADLIEVSKNRTEAVNFYTLSIISDILKIS